MIAKTGSMRRLPTLFIAEQLLADKLFGSCFVDAKWIP